MHGAPQTNLELLTRYALARLHRTLLLRIALGYAVGHDPFQQRRRRLGRFERDAADSCHQLNMADGGRRATRRGCPRALTLAVALGARQWPGVLAHEGCEEPLVACR